MALTQNQNQFAQTPVLGQVDMLVNPSIISVKIDPDSVATKLQVGQGFKLVDVAGPEIIVDQVDDEEDVVFGVAIYNPRKQLYAAGDTIEVAIGGSVVYLETSAAVARGAKVELDPSGPTVATLTDFPDDCQVGIALDKASASGQLIRVLIQPLDGNLSSY